MDRRPIRPSCSAPNEAIATASILNAARIYAIAVELLRYSDARLDPHRLNRFIHAYQTVAPLTIGELWAVAISLRFTAASPPSPARPCLPGSGPPWGDPSLTKAT
jgi:uncharacterized membrane protein YdjX (TVP38/TMEM64 family)